MLSSVASNGEDANGLKLEKNWPNFSSFGAMSSQINVSYPLQARRLLSCHCRCSPDGKSVVEVILKLGPGVGSEPIHALRKIMKEKVGGAIVLANGASAKLTDVDIVRPGTICRNL